MKFPVRYLPFTLTKKDKKKQKDVKADIKVVVNV